MGCIKKDEISSRKMMVYIVMFLWLAFGIFVSIYTPENSKGIIQSKTSITNMAIYFVSLTGFVGSFIFGDTMKTKQWTTPLFVKGANDSRETIVYLSILLWLIGGVYGVVYCVGLDQIGAYFAALTPFVAGYIFGETQRSSTPTPIVPQGTSKDSSVETKDSVITTSVTKNNSISVSDVKIDSTTIVSQQNDDQNQNSK